MLGPPPAVEKPCCTDRDGNGILHLAQRATLDAVDLAEVQGCRRAHNQLGFAYQVGFVRLLNCARRLPPGLMRRLGE